MKRALSLACLFLLLLSVTAHAQNRGTASSDTCDRECLRGFITRSYPSRTRKRSAPYIGLFTGSSDSLELAWLFVTSLRRTVVHVAVVAGLLPQGWPVRGKPQVARAD